MNDKSQVIVNGSECDSVDYERGVVTIEHDTDNEALSYLRHQIEESKQAGRVRFTIIKGRLKRFFVEDLSDAISVLVAEGFFVADFTETTTPYNEGINNNVAHYLRIEWD